jgi:DNA modification methylase
MGSGTTAIAALMEKRHFIGFEMEEKYVDIANERIQKYNEA